VIVFTLRQAVVRLNLNDGWREVVAFLVSAKSGGLSLITPGQSVYGLGWSVVVRARIGRGDRRL
jgi:hypothetical protein